MALDPWTPFRSVSLSPVSFPLPGVRSSARVHPHEYWPREKADKGVLRRFLVKVTALSRSGSDHPPVALVVRH